MMPINSSPSITTREPMSFSAIFANASSTVASGSMVQRFWPFCSSRCFTVMSRPLLLVRTFGAQSRLILEIDIRERLPVGVADDEAGLLLVDRPGRREAARRMGGEERGGSAAESNTR